MNNFMLATYSRHSRLYITKFIFSEFVNEKILNLMMFHEIARFVICEITKFCVSPISYFAKVELEKFSKIRIETGEIEIYTHLYIS